MELSYIVFMLCLRRLEVDRWRSLARRAEVEVSEFATAAYRLHIFCDKSVRRPHRLRRRTATRTELRCCTTLLESDIGVVSVDGGNQSTGADLPSSWAH